MSLIYVVEPMALADLDEVLEIERASFPSPWPRQAFAAELALPYSVLRVARPAAPGSDLAATPSRPRWWPFGGGGRHGAPRLVAGYSSLEVILQDGHIMNLAVHPVQRRQGIGELLLLDLFDQAQRRGALRLTLEVRVSNAAAQALYHKYGFSVEGERRHYYRDGESALIMWSDWLDNADTLSRLERLRAALFQRLAAPEKDRDPNPGP